MTNPVCSACIGDTYLSDKVKEAGFSQTCAYCKNAGTCWSLEGIADAVETAFKVHYSRTPTEQDEFASIRSYGDDGSYGWVRGGDQTIWAISEALECEEELAKDLQSLLEERHSDYSKDSFDVECEFDTEAHYERIMPSGVEWFERWSSFENSLKHETRFFSAEAQSLLEGIFQDIGSAKTLDNKPIIVDAGPNTNFTGFYRARVFFSEAELKKGMERPDRHLGPPPANLARAGRMNAHGISVFYGADSQESALAEVRPPVGSQTLIGRFNIVRPLRLLDLRALKDIDVVGSIFDPTYADKLAHSSFIETLSGRMSRPVMPTDEDFEYLPTQVVADYLASKTEPLIDGVLFPSAQTSSTSTNVVLFHKASRVAKLNITKGTKFDSTTEMQTSDGFETFYQVTELSFSNEKKQKEAPDYYGLDFSTESVGIVSDIRDPTLSVDAQSLTVRKLRSVKFDTQNFEVDRHKIEMPERTSF